MRIATATAAILAIFGSPASSCADPLQVKEIRAYLFFSNSGLLSENIVGSTKTFDNTVIGEGEAGGAATNVLIDLVLSNGDGPGPKQTATLKVTYKAFGRDMTLTRTFDNSSFSPGEVRHESVLIENATCFPVTIDAGVGNSAPKKATLKFGCGE